MAEVKNLFIKSKMNKDLDDRLIPSGEYRDGQNIMVSRSEGADVGALENVLGNDLINATVLNPNAYSDQIVPTNISVIGFHIDENNDRIYLWLTNYIDNSPGNLLHPQLENDVQNANVLSAITVYNTITGEYRVLVQGRFLNFSKNNIITGTNIIENLLFWTDNRNQPRKINVDNALSNSLYYTTEDQISVAKYYPYSPPRLWANEECAGQQVPQPQMKNKSNPSNPWNYGESKFLPDGVTYTNPNPTYDSEFTGDPAYLEDKFVRFSYRFRYEEDEYSLMSPFTQTAFIPKQDGYFILNLPDAYQGGEGIDSRDEDNAYKSTIVEFMENKVDSVNIYIDLPCPANELKTKFLIESIEILYKESDSVAVKVLKKIKITDPLIVDAGSNSYINWEYKSTKPIKTLPEKDTTRVSDRVPVRALTQEIVGGRVVYGNYVTSNPYPDFINYKVGISEKLSTNETTNAVSRVEYPNHTLKQNRSYQVGIVLCDRFGRQTPVILTPPKIIEEIIDGVKYKDSTIFHDYRSKGGENILYWVGDSLKILFNSTIQVINSTVINNGIYDEDTNPLGWYSYKIVVKQQEQDYYNVYLPGLLDGYLEYNTDSVINTISHSVLINDNINKIPRDLREVGPTQTTFGSSTRLYGRVNNIATPLQRNPVITPYSKFTLNQPYNTQYYPDNSADQVITIGALSDMGMGQTKTITLSHENGDNIVQNETDDIYVKDYNPQVFDNSTVIDTGSPVNPIPIGSLVKNFRENPDYDINDPTQNGFKGMKGVFNLFSETYPVTIVSKTALTFTNATFYNSPSNPLIVRMSTKKGLGSYVSPGPKQSLTVLPELAVMETVPTLSSLDIYWETSTSGLISELNEDIVTPLGPVDVGPEWRFIGDEGNRPILDPLFAQDFYFVNQLNAQVPGTIDASQSFVYRPTAAGGTQTLTIGNSANDFFQIVAQPGGAYNMQLSTGSYWTYLENYATSPFVGSLTFQFRFVPSDPNVPAVDIIKTATVGNIAPTAVIPNFIDRASVLAFTWPDPITCVNGTSNPNTDTQELILTLTSQVNILDPFVQVNHFKINALPTAGNYELELLYGAPAGSYTLTATLQDANGLGASTIYSWTINLKEPGLEGSLTKAGAELPLYTGYAGLFTENNQKSNNEYSSLSNVNWVNTPKDAQSIPMMFNSLNGDPTKWAGFYANGNNGFADFACTYAYGEYSTDRQWWGGVAAANFGSKNVSTYYTSGASVSGEAVTYSRGTKQGLAFYGGFYAVTSYVLISTQMPGGTYGDSLTSTYGYFAPYFNATPRLGFRPWAGFDDAAASKWRIPAGVAGQPLGWMVEGRDQSSDNFEDGKSRSSTSGNRFVRTGWRGNENPFIGWDNNNSNMSSTTDGEGKNMKYIKLVGPQFFKLFSTTDVSSRTKCDWASAGGSYSQQLSATTAGSIIFRTRSNVRFGEKGLKGGTALIKISIDWWNYDSNSTNSPAAANDFNQTNFPGRSIAGGSQVEAALYTNCLIQYRANGSSNWEEATDINGNTLMAGLWDSAPAQRDYYNYGSALFHRGGFTQGQVRGWTRYPYKVKGTATGDDFDYYGISNVNTSSTHFDTPGGTYSGGMINNTRYIEEGGNGYMKTQNNNDFFCWNEPQGFYWTKRGTTSPYPQGMGLRNYTTGQAQNGNQAPAQLCFAVNKVGDYRFIFDNLRQSVNDEPDGQSWTNNESTNAKPIIHHMIVKPPQNGSSGPNIEFGPGLKVEVMDLYNERPINRTWGTNSPNNQCDPTSTDANPKTLINQASGNYFIQNKQDAIYNFYAYTVNTEPYNSRESAIDPDNTDFNREQYTYLFAKEPVFRYVTQFYTRLWNGIDYTYVPWPGNSGADAWYAFTRRDVSWRDDTVPSASQITPNGDWKFPKEAGVPHGDEKAMGAPVLASGDKLYPTWAVQLFSGTGAVRTSPIPTSWCDYVDMGILSRPTWVPTADWNAGPNSQ